MTTEVIAPLAIPEEVVVGSGSYTVPANKYGYFSSNVSLAYYKNGQENGFGNLEDTISPNYQNANNTHSQWIKEGTTISVSNSFNNLNFNNTSNSTAIRGQISYARVRLNNQPICVAYAAANLGLGSFRSSFPVMAQVSGESVWSLSLFPIPKANLPEALKEGN